ncbi:MAG: transporter [Elusimicrobia bacterium]|nr:transporter [Elusimicrobiota bacterium]
MRVPLAAVVTLALSAPPAAANSIITAERPAIAPRGWTVQLDARPTYTRSAAFVDGDGNASPQSATSRQLLMIARVFWPRAMLRVSAPLVSQSQGGGGRYGLGDAVFEGGALAAPGPWRFRFLGFAKAPTGTYDKAQAVNVGGGQWDFGPALYVTRYFDEKRVDVDLWAQYAFRVPNTDSGIRPGAEFSYALTAAREFSLGAPVRAGLEHRGFFGEPHRRDGAAVGGARRSLGIGPVAQIKLDRLVKGLAVWPTAIFDVYDRNASRTQLYYLRTTLVF